jgi:hypothetical protein
MRDLKNRPAWFPRQRGCNRRTAKDLTGRQPPAWPDRSNRVRADRAKEMAMPPNTPEVPAEIWTSNLVIKAKVDAAQWLARASGEEIGQMAAVGWSGAGSHWPVIRFFATLDEDVRSVLDYARRAGVEVAFRIDRAAALSWIESRRQAAPRIASGTRQHAGGTSAPPVAPGRNPIDAKGPPLQSRGPGQRRGVARSEAEPAPARGSRNKHAWSLTQ